jgi:hypothetical protein
MIPAHLQIVSSYEVCKHTSFTAIDWPYDRMFDATVYRCNGCLVVGQFDLHYPFQFIELPNASTR